MSKKTILTKIAQTYEPMKEAFFIIIVMVILRFCLKYSTQPISDYAIYFTLIGILLLIISFFAKFADGGFDYNKTKEKIE